MDCQMPVMDGFEATLRIRAIDKHRKLPIIAVTANVSEQDQKRCMEVGMSDYVAKPTKDKSLQTVLNKWLCQSPV